MQALVTVLMPNYNNELYLREAIDSILNQTFKEFVFLIIDDGSADKSIEIIKSYTDERIKIVLKEKNSGIVDTLNLGIQHVSTKYIVRMDADDISHPKRIQLLVDFMESNPEVGVCGSYLSAFGSINETWTQELEDKRIKAKMIHCNAVTHAPAIFRTDVLKKNNIYYTNNHPYMEDYDLFFRLKGLTKFSHIDRVLYYYRVLEHNSTVKNKHTISDRRKEMYKKIITELDIEPTDKNVELHMQFFIGGIAVTYKIEEFKNWIELVLKKNSIRKIYPEKELKELMQQAWKRFFYKLVPLKLSISIDFFRLSKNVSLKQVIYLIKFKVNKLLKRDSISWIL